MSLEEFRRKYPAQTMTLGNGKPFAYRYYRNPKAAAAVVLLTGGIGLSDLFYRHFEWFAGDFSVLTFDYQIQFADNGEFYDAVAELLRRLGEKAWLVGQSLGGVVAQVIAARHPEVVEGLVLSNTCSLAKDMGDEAYSHLKKSDRKPEEIQKAFIGSSFLPFQAPDEMGGDEKENGRFYPAGESYHGRAVRRYAGAAHQAL